MKQITADKSTPQQLSDARTEFGYARTICACAECVNHCRQLPGYLIPADLERISNFLGYHTVVEFALKNLLASPGAIVMRAGHILRIPTLVPCRKQDGSCIFLSEDGACRIHKVSPFGCAFFDAHQLDTEAQARSSRGLQEIARRWAVRPMTHAYTLIWKLLDAAHLRAIPPDVARAELVRNSDHKAKGEKKAVGER